MGTVIDLCEYRERQAAKEAANDSAAELLREMYDRLFDAAFQVALADAWRQWDVENPDIDNVELDPDALLECPDPDVRALARLWKGVDEALNRLTGVDADDPAEVLP